MKILLTGAIHVGKTTVIENLQNKKIPGVSFVPETAREILASHPELEKDPRLQDILFEEQVRRETDAERHSGLVVCDRGSLDMIAHGRMWGQPVKQDWIDWTSTYMAIVLFSKDGIPFVSGKTAFDDPTRDWNKFRDSLDENIKAALTIYGFEYTVLIGTAKQRTQGVEALIRRRYVPIEGQRGVEHL